MTGTKDWFNRTTSRPGAMTVDRPDWTLPLAPDQRVAQLLNRVTFGPRPGDIEPVQQMGTDKFLEQQLHPDKIEDSAMESRLAHLPTLSMSTAELMEAFPDPNQALKAQRRQAPAGDMGEMKGDAAGAMNRQAMMQAAVQRQMEGPGRVRLELAQEELLRAVYSNRQLQEVTAQFWLNHFNIFAPKGADRWMINSFERDTIRPRVFGKFEDLLVATAQSPAMLFYLDNWLSVAPNSAPAYASGQRRPAAFWNRRAAWRRFGGPAAIRPPQNLNPAQKKRGLNENYGRELMELHTLGVNGGYTQQDVTEVARCLTGWTIWRPRKDAEFYFDPRLHDYGEKVVLGHKIPAGRGMEDGLEVLHILATHPSTARFISLKLCRRFVADNPPESVVHRASDEFLKTQGDIRAVAKTILTSPEFYSQGAFGAKVKSPLELVASALRAVGAETDAGLPLIGFMARMGEPMFLYQAPTGFPDRASTWIDSSSLLMRMNFAMLVATNRVRGTSVDPKQFDFGPSDTSSEAKLDALARRLTGGTLSAPTRQAILKQLAGEEVASLDGPAPNVPGPSADAAVTTMAALLIASPDFQRR